MSVRVVYIALHQSISYKIDLSQMTNLQNKIHVIIVENKINPKSLSVEELHKNANCSSACSNCLAAELGRMVFKKVWLIEISFSFTFHGHIQGAMCHGS